jgi:hypothetical protein
VQPENHRACARGRSSPDRRRRVFPQPFPERASVTASR